MSTKPQHQQSKHLPLIEEMTKAGATDEEMAEATGLTPGRVQHLRLRLGFRRGRARRIPNAKAAEAARLSTEESWPIPEIMAQLGVSRDFVSNHTDNDVTRRNGKDWRAVVAWAQFNCPELYREIQGMEIE